MSIVPKAVCVCIFEIDRAYGGPEEGGWYYDTGVPSEEFAIYTKFFAESEIEAIEAYVEEMRVLVERVNRVEQRRSPSSVLSNGDYLSVQVCEGFPKPYPETRPHYE